jgi:virginiamycin B lyase
MGTRLKVDFFYLRRNDMRSALWVVTALSALALEWAGPAPLLGQVPIKEWPVPYPNSRPRDPYVDSQNRVWFVGQVGNYIAYLDPKNGKFRRYEIEDGALPHNLIIDQADMVWYAGNGNGHIGKLDPKTGKITKYPMPDPEARDPHTLVLDQKGNIWFTVQGGNFVGRLATRSGKVDLIKVATANARPYGIVVDSKGRPWFNEFGSDKIAMVDPATLKIREYKLPHDNSRGRRIAITSDDRIWYVDYTRGFLGQLDPKSGHFREWALPGGPAALPYAMTSDNQDRLWMVETGAQPNRLVGFDPRTEKFFSVTPIPGGGGTVRHMMFDGRSGQIWFGTDNNTIGRAEVSDKLDLSS